MGCLDLTFPLSARESPTVAFVLPSTCLGIICLLLALAFCYTLDRVCVKSSCHSLVTVGQADLAFVRSRMHCDLGESHLLLRKVLKTVPRRSSLPETTSKLTYRLNIYEAVRRDVLNPEAVIPGGNRKRRSPLGTARGKKGI